MSSSWLLIYLCRSVGIVRDETLCEVTISWHVPSKLCGLGTVDDVWPGWPLLTKSRPIY